MRKKNTKTGRRKNLSPLKKMVRSKIKKEGRSLTDKDRHEKALGSSGNETSKIRGSVQQEIERAGRLSVGRKPVFIKPRKNSNSKWAGKFKGSSPPDGAT